MNLAQKMLIERLRQQEGDRWGSKARLARTIGVTPQFLGQVIKGVRKPGRKVLAYLGLKREVREAYRREESPPGSVA